MKNVQRSTLIPLWLVRSSRNSVWRVLLLLSVMFVQPQANAASNSTCVTAQDLAPGTYNLGAGSDEWFKLSVNAGMLYAQFASTPAVDTMLYGADCTTLLATGPINTSLIPDPSPVTYYLKVPATAAGGTLTYQTSKAFAGDDAYEPNDNMGEAFSINANSNLANLRLFDDDWFKFDAAPGRLEVKATFDTTGGKDVGLFIYNQQGLRSQMSFNGYVDPAQPVAKVADGRVLIFNVPAAGTYYLGINNYSAGNYTGLAYNLSLYHPVKWKIGRAHV